MGRGLLTICAIDIDFNLARGSRCVLFCVLYGGLVSVHGYNGCCIIFHRFLKDLNGNMLLFSYIYYIYHISAVASMLTTEKFRFDSD